MWFLANIAHAQGVFAKAKATPGVATLVNGIMSKIVLPILEGFFLFTILIFIWGVVDLIVHAADPDGRRKGEQHVLWGIVGITIMVCAYGIIRLIAATVGAGDPFQ